MNSLNLWQNAKKNPKTAILAVIIAAVVESIRLLTIFIMFVMLPQVTTIAKLFVSCLSIVSR